MPPIPMRKFRSITEQLPSSVTFVYNDADGQEKLVELRREPGSVVVGWGTATWTWRSEEYAISVGFSVKFDCERGGARQQFVYRQIGVASKTLMPPPEAGAALCDVFMPDTVVEMEYMPFHDDWPPALVCSDKARQILTVPLRPSKS